MERTGPTDLKVRADDGLPLGELKVLPHEEVEQGGRLGLRGAGAVVAALEDLVAQTAAQVGLPLEEGAGELTEKRREQVEPTGDGQKTHAGVQNLLDEESERGEDVTQRGGRLVDLEEEQVGVQHLLHQSVLSFVQQQLLLQHVTNHFTF